MVRFSAERIHEVMRIQKNVRNISVIAHVDHGKTSLTDSLVGAAGLISQDSVGTKRFCDTTKNEIEKGITIKSTSVSLLYDFKGAQYLRKLEEEGVSGSASSSATTVTSASASTPVLVNLVDSPGHVDFSSEVTAALRVTDGALVVVDVVEGCRTQTETVLRQAIQERIKPILFINKVDRAVLELQLQPEEMDEESGIIKTLDPSVGNVGFGSAKFGWAFTLNKFAEFYAKKMKVSPSALVKRFWGENYYDHEAKKWSTSNVSVSGKKLKRGFCEFILEPLYQFFTLFKNEKNEEKEKLMPGLEKMLTALQVKLTAEDKEKDIKHCVKVGMQRFIPAADALLEIIVNHLPSPVEAQCYRYPLLYTGPLDDKYSDSIKRCDPKGPLMMYVSKMVPSSEGGKFIAFGRVFSGTINAGQKVRILGSEFNAQLNKDVHIGSVQKTLLMMGRTYDSMLSCPAGSVCGLVGVDKYILKSCTITEEDAKDACPFKGMKYSVSPVVKIAVEPDNPADLNKLLEGLKRLSKSDQLVQCTVEETGQLVVAGAGELHLDMCFSDLEEEYCKGIKIRKSNPVVTFCETVVGTSEPVLSKSANKHNRLYFQAEPIHEELCKAIENGELVGLDEKERARLLVETFDWNPVDVKKIWCFGPESKGPNVLVDTTKAVADIHEIRDSCNAAFQWASKQGILCDENLRGIRINVADVTLHADTIHRGQGQILPAARKAIYGAQLSAKPRIVEPVYLVEIQTNVSVVGNIYNLINKKRGVIVGTEQTPGTPLMNVKAHLPVLESFGLTEALRGCTGGQAFPMCSFDHWKILDTQDPYDTTSRAFYC